MNLLQAIFGSRQNPGNKPETQDVQVTANSGKMTFEGSGPAMTDFEIANFHELVRGVPAKAYTEPQQLLSNEQIQDLIESNGITTLDMMNAFISQAPSISDTNQTLLRHYFLHQYVPQPNRVRQPLNELPRRSA